jgi:uncharacterized Zn-finger protein
MEFKSKRPFTFVGATPEEHDKFVAALHAAITHKLKTTTSEDGCTGEDLADAFIWEHPKVWLDVESDFARHALADYIDLLLMNQGEEAI